MKFDPGSAACYATYDKPYTLSAPLIVVFMALFFCCLAWHDGHISLMRFYCLGFFAVPGRRELQGRVRETGIALA